MRVGEVMSAAHRGCGDDLRSRPPTTVLVLMRGAEARPVLHSRSTTRRRRGRRGASVGASGTDGARDQCTGRSKPSRPRVGTPDGGTSTRTASARPSPSRSTSPARGVAGELRHARRCRGGPRRHRDSATRAPRRRCRSRRTSATPSPSQSTSSTRPRAVESGRRAARVLGPRRAPAAGAAGVV